MPHGRRELPLPARVDVLAPDCILVLRRHSDEKPEVARCGTNAAAYALVTSTYAAGELRRYWGLAAILSAGTGLGPPHPPITEIAYEFAARLPCLTLAVGAGRPVPALTELLDHVEVAA